MEEATINLDMALLIVQVEGAIITFLMGALAFFYIADKKNTNKRLDKHDEAIEALGEYMREIGSKMDSTIDIMKVNQENDSKRMDFIQALIMGKIKVAK